MFIWYLEWSLRRTVLKGDQKHMLINLVGIYIVQDTNIHNRIVVGTWMIERRGLLGVDT